VRTSPSCLVARAELGPGPYGVWLEHPVVLLASLLIVMIGIPCSILVALLVLSEKRGSLHGHCEFCLCDKYTVIK